MLKREQKARGGYARDFRQFEACRQRKVGSQQRGEPEEGLFLKTHCSRHRWDGMGWDGGDVCAGARGRRGCAVLLPPLQQSPALTVTHALDCVLDVLFGLGKVITRLCVSLG